MRNICFLGNSHLAAFKLGWDMVKGDYPETTVTFFGAPGFAVGKAIVADGALVPNTDSLRESFKFLSGGKDKVEPDEYDEFFVIGQFGLPTFLLFARRHAPEWWPLPARNLVSDACFDLAIGATSRLSIALRVADKLASITDKKINIVPDPMLSADILKDERHKLWTTVAASEHAGFLRTKFRETCDALSSPQLSFLAQPESTIDGEAFTRPDLCRGAVELKEGFNRVTADIDYSHMNGRYGKAYFQQIMERSPPTAS